jgi:siroheme synthase-like protein
MTPTPILPRMFPIFLKLEGRPVLVVGAGPVATEKVEALLDAGARITVVAPEATVLVRDLARSGRIVRRERGFRPDDVHGFRVVVAATGDPAVNRRVYETASSAGLPVNVVDVPDLCDFYFGSVVRRGPVTVAISTAGSSPALARRLREHLDELLPRRLADLARALARTRPRLVASIPGFRDRVRAVERLLDDVGIPALDGRSGDEISGRVDDWIEEVAS